MVLVPDDLFFFKVGCHHVALASQRFFIYLFISDFIPKMAQGSLRKYLQLNKTKRYKNRSVHLDNQNGRPCKIRTIQMWPWYALGYAVNE